ncbi:MAG: lipopolysaccharide assembly protein LapB [Rhodanobacter sp.]|jgi:lipopolysaccharide biosynthesis regulator YciM|uniref:Lipopolysaccharide assembly protein B n=1 Tax=Rhodanobacter glycinis TaxID=582702 RepID=A0A5B9DXH9_9GAMM|nr:lipopolysaccharide assembly protein LapB [Rhodanobacter glycinis]QEE24732.1 lipopolysaccharide assembly protein LapB [Rhodanobacter glycinis]TAM27587.1 MAG: lipopolysaccharide assembly protein LapB [Rhodanobacter sp.]
MTPIYLLALLIPAAFISGWWTARRAGARRSGARVSELSSDYFRGLNYLLNEEQDKAIEVFLRLAEYNRDTVETHLALGNLFRRRGEVDRAIRLHQHLVSRPGLTEAMKTVALLELGEDYMRAGLLDRAETLFSDLVAMNAHAPSALRHLIAIYQHERDWHKAIEHARRLEAMAGEDESTTIAQFYCELAEQSRQHGARADAREYLKQAFECQPECVRAFMLTGRLYVDEGRQADAVDAYEQAVNADIAFVPEILPPLLDGYARSGQMERAERFLCDILARYNGISPVLALTRLYQQRDGEKPAIEFLTSQLRQRPSVRGLMALIDATMDKIQGEARENFLILRDLTRKLLEGQAMYRCSRCGFGAKAHHWQCPSCKNWSTIRPIHGVANE